MMNFIPKLNKSDLPHVVTDEEFVVTRGTAEGFLAHDNIIEKSIEIYTLPHREGNRVLNYTLDVKHGFEWRRFIKIFSNSSSVFVSYESYGDTVEADDINILQAEIAKTNSDVSNIEGNLAENTDIISNIVTKPVDSGITTSVIEMELGGINTDNGSLIESNIRLRSKEFIPIDKQRSYKLSNTSGYTMLLLFYDKSKSFLWHEDNISGNGVFSTTSDRVGFFKICTKDNDSNFNSIFSMEYERSGHGYVLNADRVICNELKVALQDSGSVNLGNGYSLRSDMIDPGLYKAMVDKDNSEFNIFEIHAPDSKPYESTLALMNWGKGIKQFVDISSMHYTSDISLPGTVEIVCQSRGGFPLPEFSVRYNDGQGAGRIKKFTIHPDAVPIELTSEGLKVRRDNRFSNSNKAEDFAIINLASLEDINLKVKYLMKMAGINELDMSFNFNSADTLSIGGSVSLLGVGGRYDLYWCDGNGNILNDYDSFANIKVDVGVAYSLHIPDHIVAPAGAVKLGAFSGFDESAIAFAVLPDNKMLSSSNLGTRSAVLGVLSDTHIDSRGDSADKAKSVQDFHNAVNFYEDINVDAIIIDGDVTYDGTLEDYQFYKSTIDNLNLSVPIYTSRGNHDCNTTLTNYTTYVQPEGLYYEKEINNEVLLFVGMRQHNFDVNCFNSSTITWLGERLETYKNRRVLLFFHPFMQSTCGNPKDLYLYGILDETADKPAQFCNWMRTYKNVVYFSGHSHFSFKMQKYSDHANIFDNGTTCHRVHIPSCSKPRFNDDGIDKNNTYEVYEGSEGYVVEVYDRGLLLRGRDFIKGKYVSLAQYWIDTTLIPM